jgi:hypothetical protein
MRRAGLSLLFGTTLIGAILLVATIGPAGGWPPIVVDVLDVLTVPGGFVLYLYKPRSGNLDLLWVVWIADALFYSAVAWILLGVLGRNRRRKE